MMTKFTGKAKEIIEKVLDSMTGKKTGEQEDGTWVDAAYLTKPINVFDIISQAVNPNYQSGSAFSALQQSITNTGMVFPIEIGENPLYDPKKEEMAQIAIENWNKGNKNFTFDGETHTITEGKEKRLIILDGDNEVQIDISIGKPRCYSGGQDTVDVRNPKLRAYYKYQVIDGTHRLLAVLYGSPMYEDLVDKKTWEKSNFIFKRCHGMVPCTVIEGKSEQELMSATILMNSARGEHDMMEMKDIVCDLLRSGMSQQWISANLFLDPSAINRFSQLGGIKAAFANTENLGGAWDPVKDRVEERRKNINLTQAARRYVRKYRALAGFDNTNAADESIDILEAARNLGWNDSEPNMIPKTLDQNGKVFEKELNADE